MLPYTILPSGALTAMRQTANQFMTTELALYAPTITYSAYGEQIITSGTPRIVSGYVGAIRGTDRELLKQSLQAYTQNDGIKTRTDALVLLPFETPITTNTIVRLAGEDWDVIYTTNNTQDSVQVYTKALIVQFVIHDERIR